MLVGRDGSRMSGYNFSDDARRALGDAVKESRRLWHDYIGTEHILLGLIREGEGVAVTVLQNLNVDLNKIRRKVDKIVKKGKPVPTPRPEFPYTSRAKKVLELAMSEAVEFDHLYVGAEHILLGLLREERGIAAEVLMGAGVSLDAARAETLRILETETRSTGGARQYARQPEFHVRVDDASDRSIYEQIVAQVQEAIATGRLAPGERLPTVRRLADELDIAPGTVARAYVELERLGVIVTGGARGTHVAPRDASGLPARDRPETLIGLLRPVVVAAFHVGASAQELREALEKAMKDIFGDGKRDAA